MASSKLYLSGIEITYSRYPFELYFTPNCTLVELKCKIKFFK